MKMTSFYFVLARTFDTNSVVKFTRIVPCCLQARYMSKNKVSYPTMQKRFFTELKGNDVNGNICVNSTIYFGLKMIYLLALRDSSLLNHLTNNFIYGASAAFFHITECLNNKEYNKLSEVVTSDLLNEIKDGVKLTSELAESDVFHVKEFRWMEFSDIDLIYDKVSNVKTIEVHLKYGYLTRNIKSYSDFFKSFESNMAKLKYLYTGHLKFFRTYGENVKDSQWFVKDIYYTSPHERKLLSRGLY